MLECIEIQLTKKYMHMKNNLIISGLHLDLTDALKNIVSDKMVKIFKHEEKIIRARVELDQDSRSSSHKNQFTAKGHLELKGTTITISSSSDNLYKAIDDLIEKRQMVRTATFSNFRPTQEIGSHGVNAWSIADVTGPVWEWTLTCWFSSDEENRRPWTINQLNDPNLCPNRVVQGDERAHVPYFVDKVYTGGCGTGSPVDHIGFRIVKDASGYIGSS